MAPSAIQEVIVEEDRAEAELVASEINRRAREEASPGLPPDAAFPSGLS